MRVYRRLTAFCLCAAAVAISGCDSGSKKTDVSGRKGKTALKLRGTPRVVFNAQENPTTEAGRGEPVIDDQFRPPAWVFVDGHGGTFGERLEWMIEGNVRPSPTFRVEIVESIVGSPKDFSCLLRARDGAGETDVYYAIAAKDGTFEYGKEYSLLAPGDSFVVRNGFTQDVVAEIPPLPPGNYLITGAVGKPGSEKRVLAVSHFTVGDE